MAPAPPAEIKTSERAHRHLQPHKLDNHVYYGSRPWQNGVWRHQPRNGRLGWRWDTGGVAYFYLVSSEGAPDTISSIAEPEVAASDSDPATSVEPRRAYFYKPGEITGSAYELLEACRKAQEDAGNTGICIMK